MKKYLKFLLLIFMGVIIFTACTGKEQGYGGLVLKGN